MPMRNHESILVFCREGQKTAATYNPVKEFNEHNVGAKSGSGNRSSNKRNDGRNVYSTCSPVDRKSDGWMHPRSVIHCKRDVHGNQRLHSTQKPVALMEWLIKSFTNEGDLVIDPFMGSGSTGIACIRTNRRFIGIEMDQKYYESAVNRIRRDVELQQ
jgi:DNA modification methylase